MQTQRTIPERQNEAGPKSCQCRPAKNVLRSTFRWWAPEQRPSEELSSIKTAFLLDGNRSELSPEGSSSRKSRLMPAVDTHLRDSSPEATECEHCSSARL